MTEEFFGPIVSAFVYDDARFDEVSRLIDETSTYGLTGAVFAADHDAIARASSTLRYGAGNFYINDKPTGRRWPAALRRCARLGHERQGGIDVEPDAMGVAANDQGDIQSAQDYRYRFMS
jgi:1-pyrroline-5-carboxylate dehydrogenase